MVDKDIYVECVEKAHTYDIRYISKITFNVY